MRDFILLTAVCVVVVVGVGWLLLPGSPTDLFRSRVVVQAQTPGAPDTPAAAAGEPHAKAVTVAQLHPIPDRTFSSSVAPALDSTSNPAAAPAASPINTLANLRLPWDVLPGEQGSEVVDTYGAPTLYTSTQDSGHLFETYVYRSSGTQAIIHLEDGRVSRVSMKDSPRPGKP
jgi:hypothetical protein